MTRKYVPPDTERIRAHTINALRKAFRVALNKIKTAEAENPNQIPVKWYTTVAYLSQTLNKLMKDADDTQIKRRLAELRHMVAELESRNPGPEGAPRGS